MIDSHCHLDSKIYGGQIDGLLADAASAGIHTIVNIGADLSSSEISVQFATKYPMVYATVGVHPHDAKTLDDKVVTRLRELAKHPKVIAIGEIGLDYYRDLSPRPVQKEAFRRQLELAIEMKKPIVVHTRESFEDTLAIVKEYAARLPGGIFHCFPGTAEDARRVFDLGFVISVGGVITYPKSGMAEMVTQVPLEKIVLETDSPYLTPVPHRGKTNRPAFVSLVAAKLADLRGITKAEVVKITDRTCQKVYRLVETFGG